MMTYNPYAPNPYIQQGQQQDIGGLAPMFQNINAQQAQLNQAIAQNQGLNQQVGGMGGGGGFNNLAMAAMLRKGGPQSQQDINASDVQMSGLSTYNPFTQSSIAQQYGTDPYSQSSRMIAAQEQGFR